MPESRQSRPKTATMRPARQMKRLSVLFAGIVVCVVIGWLTRPYLFADAERAHRASRILENQLEIAHALRAYAARHDGAYPRSAESWKQLLMDECGLRETAFYPLHANSAENAYWYVPGLRVGTDRGQVLLYESPELRQSSGGYVVYTNGDFEYYPEPEYDQLLGTILLPDGTPWAPHLDD